MTDFYARIPTAAPAPRAALAPRGLQSPRGPQPPRALQDQADGLRRMFGVRRRVVLPLAANPHGASSPRVLDRLAAVLASQGHHVLVVDAASTSPLPHELAAVDLSACVLNVAPRVSYLAARGLPMDYVDTRGSAAAFVQAVQDACPQADVVLLHADGIDLARLMKQSAVRPLLLAADHPESIKHAYANAKLLARRCELLTFDLLLVASGQSPRAASISDSLSSCLDTFLGAVLKGSALIDTNLEARGPAGARASAELARLLAAQLAMDETAPAEFLSIPSRQAPRLDARADPGSVARTVPSTDFR
jgi:flagellar biosynthesis protein FlhG